MAVEASDGPDDATGSEVERSPGTFVVEGRASDERDGADRAVRLFLLGDSAEAVASGVAVEAKKARIVGNGVPVHVNQDRESFKFAEELSDDYFHFRSEICFNIFFEQVVGEVEPGVNNLQDFAVVTNAFDE